MDGDAILDTRGRILDESLNLFGKRGYQSTSLREIAERLGLSKAAILYHFPSKAHLIAALGEPLWTGLEDAVSHASRVPEPEAARWRLIEDTLDVYLRNRRLLSVLFREISALAFEPALSGLVDLAAQAHAVVAGPDADERARIRAAQVFAALGDPVMFMTDAPLDVLRAEVLTGARILLADIPLAGGESSLAGGEPSLARGEAPTPPPAPVDASPPDIVWHPRPRRGGRPTVMDADRLAEARRMHAEGTRSVSEIAAELGVSRATLYRHLAVSKPSRN